MANTGYKINPKVVQIYTTGPNAGFPVTSSFDVTFDPGSGFISASLCNQFFYYRVFDPYNCPVPSYCPPPSIATVTPQNCSGSFNYTYQFNIGAGSSSVPQLRVEYSLDSAFSGEVKGTTITDYSGSTISPLSVDITTGLTNRTEISSSGLITLPLNKYTPVYFRAYSICSGSNSSSYSNIQGGQCSTPPPGIQVTDMTIGNGFCNGGFCQLAFPASVTIYTNNGSITAGQTIYSDAGLTTPFITSNYLYRIGTGYVYSVNGVGKLVQKCIHGDPC